MLTSAWENQKQVQMLSGSYYCVEFLALGRASSTGLWRAASVGLVVHRFASEWNISWMHCLHSEILYRHDLSRRMNPTDLWSSDFSFTAIMRLTFIAFSLDNCWMDSHEICGRHLWFQWFPDFYSRATSFHLSWETSQHLPDWLAQNFYYLLFPND